MAVQIYGNEIWNKATNNDDKRIITAQAAEFPQIQEKLENAGMNYCAYYSGISAVIAVNKDDAEKIIHMLGISNLEPKKARVEYIPPEKNIIGNAEYRYIPQKEYISADRDLILKMADNLNRQGIKFSGRIYPTGKGTLTVSNADLMFVKSIRDGQSKKWRYSPPI